MIIGVEHEDEGVRSSRLKNRVYRGDEYIENLFKIAKLAFECCEKVDVELRGSV